ncbi:YlxP-like protein [Candidatus Syntrophocurvum alkaliphilum]|uniref:YlxP-like protein n=1 Tax=Candidatus Syntrophocurvum alkaliphilum TaxID=2293317 RepID=A0A6I6DIH8_9FIRM|nr:DUF503 domain-containing protein [Candidatus Syntrophocurvum alkaliphilum]QGT99331.1 YlxP-like protein [Candidatus Syntrophocurvum alkaliphilum]
MYIVYGQAELFFPYTTSLKEKRKTINSIIDRIRKRFNISVAEVEYQDLWQRSILGFTAVSNSHSDMELFTNVVEDTIYRFTESVELTSFSYQILSE